MGNDSSNTNSSSNNTQSTNNMEAVIDSAFSFTKSNLITRSQFNQAIKIFEAISYISICNSHLASRLYDILEPDTKGRLDKHLVANKLKKLIKDPSKANRYSFRLYDTDNDGKISRREFSDYFQKSWATQIQIVRERLKQQPNFDGAAFYEWLKNKRQDILQISGQIFGQIDNKNKNNVDLQDFQRWINSGHYDMMVFKYADTTLKFPLHIGAIITNN